MSVFRKFPIASLTAAGLIAGALMLSSVRAQQASAVPNLSGTWIQTITLQGQPPFEGLVTFHADGTLTDTDQEDVMPPDYGSPGHGVWQNGRGNTYRFKLIKLLSIANSAGVPDGLSISTGTLTMQGVDAYQSSGTALFYNASGQVTLTLPFTSSGKRVTLSN